MSKFEAEGPEDNRSNYTVVIQQKCNNFDKQKEKLAWLDAEIKKRSEGTNDKGQKSDKNKSTKESPPKKDGAKKEGDKKGIDEKQDGKKK